MADGRLSVHSENHDSDVGSSSLHDYPNEVSPTVASDDNELKRRQRSASDLANEVISEISRNSFLGLRRRSVHSPATQRHSTTTIDSLHGSEQQSPSSQQGFGDAVEQQCIESTPGRQSMHSVADEIFSIILRIPNFDLEKQNADFLSRDFGHRRREEKNLSFYGIPLWCLSLVVCLIVAVLLIALIATVVVVIKLQHKQQLQATFLSNATFAGDSKMSPQLDEAPGATMTATSLKNTSREHEEAAVRTSTAASLPSVGFVSNKTAKAHKPTLHDMKQKPADSFALATSAINDTQPFSTNEAKDDSDGDCQEQSEISAASTTTLYHDSPSTISMQQSDMEKSREHIMFSLLDEGDLE